MGWDRTMETLPTGERISKHVSSAGTRDYVIPGIPVVSAATLAMTVDRMQYEPFILSSNEHLDRMSFEVTVAGAASTVIRTGIYVADNDWQVTDLVVDAGTGAADAVAVVNLTVDVDVPRGRYIKVIGSSGAPTMRVYRGPLPFVPPGMGANIIQGMHTNTLTGQITGGLNDPGTQWAATVASGTAFEHRVLMRFA